jgi:hypothetical protein
VCPGNDPKFFGALNPHEPHEVLHITFVCPPRLLIADVPKPLNGRGHLGKLVLWLVCYKKPARYIL